MLTALCSGLVVMALLFVPLLLPRHRDEPAVPARRRQKRHPVPDGVIVISSRREDLGAAVRRSA
ncbi:MAG TPA: hypothetical protein VN636_16610 [Acidimicrobiia bacterium]|nr:hypothetical protein [Acidimicrobiia bacterium]